MILVDVYVAALDETYDFMLEENVAVEKIILELCEMLAKRRKSPDVGDVKSFQLYRTDIRRKLGKNRTLLENGVRDGNKLLLV